MISIRNFILIVATVLSVLSLSAQETSEPQVKGRWFAAPLYSINIANNGNTYSRIGALGGYLGKWGAYAKVDFSLGVNNSTPNATAGFTKRVATFQGSGNHSTLHFFFGLGMGNLEHVQEYPEHDHIYHPDGSVECDYSNERRVKYWDNTLTLMAETGLIYSYGHLNCALGYGITPDVGGALFGSGNAANHSIMVAVGYTF